MIRLALFDIDGTLIRTHGAGVRAFAQALEAEFQYTAGLEGVSFAGRTDTGLVREFLLRQGVQATPEHFQRFFDRYVHLLAHHLQTSAGGVVAGVREFMAGLRALPEPPVLGLLTGNIRLGAEIKLRRYGIWEPFQTGAFADDHEDRDQIAAIARARGEALLARRLCGEEILVVGDTPLDIRCGRAIGARVLAVGTGGAAIEELRSHRPDWLAADLRGLSAAEICAG
jgi:phosphoglycolate phosphatase-like HAD superfamily hydrolase